MAADGLRLPGEPDDVARAGELGEAMREDAIANVELLILHAENPVDGTAILRLPRLDERDRALPGARGGCAGLG